MTNYTRVADHRMNPDTVRRGQALLVGIKGDLYPGTYVDGPISLSEREHFVHVGGAVHIIDEKDLYEAPAMYVEDTAVYAGDTVYEKKSGDPVIIPPDARLLAEFAHLLTVKCPIFEHTGYITLNRMYGSAPRELYPHVGANPHVFVEREDAEKAYPNAIIVQVVWSDSSRAGIY